MGITYEEDWMANLFVSKVRISGALFKNRKYKLEFAHVENLAGENGAQAYSEVYVDSTE